MVIDNYRFGALARAGLDYESLAAVNPRLIYCSISGFGASGPRRDDPANDLFMQAFSGGMSITGEIGGGPMKMGLSVADLGAGMMGTIGMLMALEARHATGRGQRVDTSLLEGQMSMLSYHLCRYFATGMIPEPSGSGSATQVPYQAFKARRRLDRHRRVQPAHVGRLLRRRPAIRSGSAIRASPTPRRRAQHRDELLGLIGDDAGRASRRSTGSPGWTPRACRAPGSTASTRRCEEEQVAAREMIVEIDVPGLGPIKVAGLPIKLSETPGRIERHPPHLGEHTDEILRALGYDDERDGQPGRERRGRPGRRCRETSRSVGTPMTTTILTDEMRGYIGRTSDTVTARATRWSPARSAAMRRRSWPTMTATTRRTRRRRATAARWRRRIYPAFMFRRPFGTPDVLSERAEDPDFDGLVSAASDGLPELPLPGRALLNGGSEIEFLRYARHGERVQAALALRRHLRAASPRTGRCCS